MKTQKKVFRSIGTKTIQSNMKNGAILFSVCLFQASSMFSQSQTYDNFEGNKVVHYGVKTGVLDTLAENPAHNSINGSKKCAKYVRNGKQKFDNIKMNLFAKLTGVDKYATYTGVPSTFSMKVYTTAPVGTLIEIQLGKNGKHEYPAGINSIYQAHTTVINAWEVVQFKFSQIPKGSETSEIQVDEIIVMFNPNSLTSDTYYFDDITGPSLVPQKAESLATPANNKSTSK
jgi:hypothetical protein